MKRGYNRASGTRCQGRSEPATILGCPHWHTPSDVGKRREVGHPHPATTNQRPRYLRPDAAQRGRGPTGPVSQWLQVGRCLWLGSILNACHNTRFFNETWADVAQRSRLGATRNLTSSTMTRRYGFRFLPFRWVSTDTSARPPQEIGGMKSRATTPPLRRARSRTPSSTETVNDMAPRYRLASSIPVNQRDSDTTEEAPSRCFRYRTRR